MRFDRITLLLIFVTGALLISFSPKPAMAGTEILWQVPLKHPALAKEFRQPSSDWSAGHRGVDYFVQDGESVLASHDGVISIAEVVVNRSVLTITHDLGLKTSYEPVCSQLRVGTKVKTGEPIGSVCAGSNYISHCGLRLCLHFSMRNINGYLSPLVRIGGLSPSRLKPWDGLTCSQLSNAQC